MILFAVGTVIMGYAISIIKDEDNVLMCMVAGALFMFILVTIGEALYVNLS